MVETVAGPWLTFVPEYRIRNPFLKQFFTEMGKDFCSAWEFLVLWCFSLNLFLKFLFWISSYAKVPHIEAF